MNPRILNLTLLFTYNCPLQCTYCNLYKDEKKKTMTLEEMSEQIEHFIQDYPDELKQVCITGGEPFLYPDIIKALVEKFGDKVMFLFYTSGYCFNDDILEFLSHYKVDFTLSVDGGESLTKYLRPAKSGKPYFEKLKENMPSLLYYFPGVTAKVIINHNYIDKLYEIYLNLEQIGFRYIYFTMDFTERQSNDEGAIHAQHIYSEEEKMMMQYQFMKIANQMVIGFKKNIRRAMVTNILRIGRVITDDSVERVPQNLMCGIYNGANMYDINTRHLRGGCYEKFKWNLQDFQQEMTKEFLNNQVCPKDIKCGCWKYCSISCCPSVNLENNGNLMNLEENQCLLNKISYDTLSYILSLMNNDEAYSYEYTRFLSLMKEG